MNHSCTELKNKPNVAITPRLCSIVYCFVYKRRIFCVADKLQSKQTPFLFYLLNYNFIYLYSCSKSRLKSVESVCIVLSSITSMLQHMFKPYSYLCTWYMFYIEDVLKIMFWYKVSLNFGNCSQILITLIKRVKFHDIMQYGRLCRSTDCSMYTNKIV